MQVIHLQISALVCTIVQERFLFLIWGEEGCFSKEVNDHLFWDIYQKGHAKAIIDPVEC